MKAVLTFVFVPLLAFGALPASSEKQPRFSPEEAFAWFDGAVTVTCLYLTEGRLDVKDTKGLMLWFKDQSFPEAKKQRVINAMLTRPEYSGCREAFEEFDVK